MIQLQLALVILVVAGNLSASSEPQSPKPASEEKTLFEDSFDGKLADGWSWLRDDEKARRVVQGALEIRSQPGLIHEAKTFALRDVPAAGGRVLAAEVTVSNQPSEQWEQCGIVWYYDDQHLVKLVKERVDGKTWMVMGKAHPRAGQLVAKVPLAEAAVQLRLVVEGSKITGHARPGGKGKWQQLGTCDLPGEGKAKLGLITFHGPANAEHWARFEKFRVLVPGE